MKRVIHCCWFGRGEMSELAKKVIRSWHTFAPNFEIVLWNEDNSNLDECDFITEAYKAHAWAFVADYIRYRALYEHGGIYMDLGSELVKDITPLLCKTPFSAIEGGTLTVNPGLIMASEPYDRTIKEILETYKNMHFENTDEFKAANTVNEITTRVFERYGYVRKDEMQVVSNWTLLPAAFFCPVYGLGGFHIKKETYSIHHYTGSWRGEVQKKQRVIRNKIAPFIGDRPAEIVGRVVAEIEVNGLGKGLGACASLVKKNI